MSFTKFSEKIILNKLKNIKDGNLKLVNYDGKVFHFGNLESKLSADIKIINSQAGKRTSCGELGNINRVSTWLR